VATLLTRWISLLVLAGIGAVIAGYLGYRSGQIRSAETEEEMEHYAAGIRTGNGRLPLVLVALYVGVAVAMVGYVIWVSGLGNGL
jgi:ABC-type enterobactin transport system permease subunit